MPKRFAPPRQLRPGGDIEALKSTLGANERYLRRWANRLGAWTAYTPSWTADTTPPVIGNGTIEGKYMELGNLIVVRFAIKPGSTTTFGTGNYHVSTPIPSEPLDDALAIGHITLSGGASRYHYSLVLDTQGLRGASDSDAAWSPTAPFTMADGDAYIGQGVYEAL